MPAYSNSKLADFSRVWQLCWALRGICVTGYRYLEEEIKIDIDRGVSVYIEELLLWACTPTFEATQTNDQSWSVPAAAVNWREDGNSGMKKTHG